tara:strand:- start:820 stop:1050 length:231 start_codon:yes stop_codon:yes gene_type:complete
MNTDKLAFLMGDALNKKEKLITCIKIIKKLCRMFIEINIVFFSSYKKYVITYKQLIERIRALKNDGSVIKDINAFE